MEMFVHYQDYFQILADHLRTSESEMNAKIQSSIKVILVVLVIALSGIWMKYQAYLQPDTKVVSFPSHLKKTTCAWPAHERAMNRSR